jgi:flagellar hook assembly protein FlgD
MDELGSIHVGNNTSQYAWDGKDQYGDELANGVYLYEVLIKSSNDEAYTHRNTAGDGMFKNGIGKMYKIR